MKKVHLYLLAIIAVSLIVFDFYTGIDKASSNTVLETDDVSVEHSLAERKESQIKSELSKSPEDQLKSEDNIEKTELAVDKKERVEENHLQKPIDEIPAVERLSKSQTNFALTKSEDIKFDFDSESVDWKWKESEEKYYNTLYDGWLSVYPATAVDLSSECKSQHCQLELNGFSAGPTSTKEIGTFIKELKNSRRPFNLVNFNMMKGTAIILTKRQDEK